MRKAWLAMLLACVCLLSGCSEIYRGSYSTVQPHVQTQTHTTDQTLTAKDMQELRQHIEKMLDGAKEEGVIYVDGYDQNQVQKDMKQICNSIKLEYPVASFALDNISFELGKRDGRPALSLAFRYVRSRVDILSIRSVADMNMASIQICNALARCDVSLVLRVSNYEKRDFQQIIDNYAVENPDLVMETPRVSWEVYPGKGNQRMLELFFTYQTSCDSLKSMQEKVEPVFASAELYVSGDAGEQEKYSQLFSFLMERYDYQYSTSITPTYSLLRHGVGDSRAFAMVYAAMCRRAGLESIVVSGTKDGESHYWNIIRRDDGGYHVDLRSGSYCERGDEQMEGYVWDYSAYPVCIVEIIEEN